jgi:V/A-type H+-transporting ATPase subunit I
MLRPERMSRVSVTGSAGVMDDVIETVHDRRVLDMSDYDGSWEGFDLGEPIEGADEASQKLVTVRSLKSILDVDDSDAGPTRLVSEAALAEELEDIRQDVNEFDDRRSDLRGDLRDVRDRINTVEPFAALGIDLDLLAGYESLVVAVGDGDEAAIDEALADADAVEAYDLFTAEDAVAVFVYPTEDPATVDVQDLLVGVQFQQYDVPDADGSPDEYVSELRHREQQLESKLETVENEIREVKLDVAGFLLAAEEKLTIEVQRAEAPLQFATTENAFVAEGWVPTDEVATLERELEAAVGDHVDVEELERASYDGDGHVSHREEVEHGGGHVVEEPTAVDGGADDEDGEATAAEESQDPQTAATDGGAITMGDDQPPVVQDNPGPAKPFEALVEVINRPKYGEFDPTMVLFLTFPAFFGFMIGDLGYGLLYVLLGGWLWTSFDSDVIKSLGGVGVWAGLFTMLFGVLYGEFFGLHQLGEVVWGGSPPLHKGLNPAHADYAVGWLVVSLLVGMAHLAVGWIFDFVENLEHGLMDAIGESGSWLLMMFGMWAWIFANAPPTGKSPDLLYGAESVFYGHPFPVGFPGFTEPVGYAGIAAFFVGLTLLTYTAPIEFVESLNVLVNVLSYTRLAAVLLAKAGMAFVVNLLFFGVYVTHDGAWHFGTSGMPEMKGQEHVMFHGHEVTDVMFGGLMHGGIGHLLVGILILVIGHLLVLTLGITSAGLQGVRLEYVEFFGKFFEGGGRAYEPFGYVREYTTED